jgi:hypothetical protein
MLDCGQVPFFLHEKDTRDMPGSTVRSQVRRTGLITLAILVGTVAMALAVARVWHLGVAGTVVTVLVGGGVLPTLYLTWATFRDSAQNTSQLGMAELADQLAIAVDRQWAAEASVRRLNDPYPLPVSWSAADLGVADSWDVLQTLARSGAGWPSLNPGEWASHPGQLAGKDGELAADLSKVPTGRLVVLGEPGAGKTMLMVRLVLDLLKDRRPGGPVPFLVSLASWNPREQDLYGWLAAQLVVGRPALRERGQGSDDTLAEILLDAGLIVPLLDGLDEIPESVRGPAIARMNDALRAGQMTVVTCRTADYRRAVSPPGGPEVRLRGAAAVQLDPLTAEAVGAYLIADAGGPNAAARWASVLKALKENTPVSQTLTTPLMAGLARAIYNPRPDELVGNLRDPAELCAPELVDRQAVEAHLFGAFIPSCYRAASGWTAYQVKPWLAFLAHHLQATIGGTDLAWWLLRQSTPFADHERTPSHGQRKPPLRTPVPTSRVSIRPARIARAVVLGGVVGIGMGMFARFGGTQRGATPVTPWAIGIGFGLFIALIIIIFDGLAPVPHDLKAAISPHKLVANDRRISFVMISVVAAGTVSFTSSLGWGGIPLGLLLGIAMGALFAGLLNPWPAYAAGRVYLALRGNLPWKLLEFLEDAHRRGVLRQAGAVYQFWHVELQRQLATGYEEPPLQWWQSLQQAQRLKKKMLASLTHRWFR